MLINFALQKRWPSFEHIKHQRIISTGYCFLEAENFKLATLFSVRTDLTVFGCWQVSMAWQFIMNRLTPEQIHFEKHASIRKSYQSLSAFFGVHNRPLKQLIRENMNHSHSTFTPKDNKDPLTRRTLRNNKQLLMYSVVLMMIQMCQFFSVWKMKLTYIHFMESLSWFTFLRDSTLIGIRTSRSSFTSHIL